MIIPITHLECFDIYGEEKVVASSRVVDSGGADDAQGALCIIYIHIGTYSHDFDKWAHSYILAKSCLYVPGFICM